MAGALRRPTLKGKVKLDVVSPSPRKRPPVETREETVAQTTSPNPNLEAAIEAADALPDSVAEESKPKQSRTATVLKVVKDVADATDSRPSRKPPTADEWEKPIARGMVYVSVFYVWWLTTDDEGNELGDTSRFELDDERAALISTPFARLWARTPLNRRYGRDMIENVDMLVAVSALVTYVMDTRPLWNAKRAREQARMNNNNVLPIRRQQTTTAVQHEVNESQARRAAPEQKVNGGTQPHEQPEPTIDGPYRTPLPFTPGQQNSTD